MNRTIFGGWHHVAALLAFGVVLVWAGCAGDGAKYPQVSVRGQVVAIELADIPADSGRFFTYRSGAGKNVDLLVYRESSGTAHAVLDACRTCYRWKKGYVLEGKEMVCIKCDMRFKLDDLAGGSGSCVPLALTGERRGETLLIPVAELEAAARYF